MTAQLLTAGAIFANFSSFDIGLRDYLDMIVVAFLVYAIVLLFKKTRSLFLFNGVAVLVLTYIFARYFGLYLTSYLFNFFFGFFVIIFVLVFKRELRGLFRGFLFWGK